MLKRQKEMRKQSGEKLREIEVRVHHVVYRYSYYRMSGIPVSRSYELISHGSGREKEMLEPLAI